MVSKLDILDVYALAPVSALVGIAAIMIVLEVFSQRKLRLAWSLLACVAALVCYLPLASLKGLAVFGQVFNDGYTWMYGSLIVVSGMLVFLLSHNKLGAQRANTSIDVDLLLLFSLTGALVTVSAANFILLFIGVELLSIPLYVLAGIARNERSSAEAALKYFILGAFSSALFLYGIVLIYGVTGTMNIAQVAHSLPQANGMFLLGLGLIIFGFGFKVGLVPFHMWVPDVYQGSPTSITTYMAVIVKAAGFGAFVRVMQLCFLPAQEQWAGMIWTLAVLTMTIGNLAALRQRSVKRMLAYSSIAHSGYAVMGILGLASANGASAIMFYLIAYSLMTIGSFGVVLLVTAGTDSQYDKDDLESLSGLGWSKPFLGLVMSIAMLSLAGIPPLAGFVGKFYIFSSVIQSGYTGLAIIAAVNSAISLYYYLRVLVVMYFKTDSASDAVTQSDMAQNELTFAPALALSLATAGTLLFGIFADTLRVAVDLAVKSIG